MRNSKREYKKHREELRVMRKISDLLRELKKKYGLADEDLLGLCGSAVVMVEETN